MPLQRFLVYFCALVAVCFWALPHALPTPSAETQSMQSRVDTTSDTADRQADAPTIQTVVLSTVMWHQALLRRQFQRQRLSGFAAVQGDLPGEQSTQVSLLLSLKATAPAAAV